MPRLIVPDRVRERLERSCEVPLSLCPVPAELFDGAIVTLTSRKSELLALAVVDRGAACWRVMARGEASGDALDARWAETRLGEAVAARAPFGLAATPDSAYRLLNGAVKDVPKLPYIALGRKKVVRRSTFEDWKRVNEGHIHNEENAGSR